MRKLMIMAAMLAMLMMAAAPALAQSGSFDFHDPDDFDGGDFFVDDNKNFDRGDFFDFFVDEDNDFFGEEEDEEDIDFENVDGCTAVIEAEELDAVLCPVTDIFGNETLEEVNV